MHASLTFNLSIALENPDYYAVPIERTTLESFLGFIYIFIMYLTYCIYSYPLQGFQAIPQWLTATQINAVNSYHTHSSLGGAECRT